MDKKEFYSSKFQKDFYDKLAIEKRENLGMLSCGYEERYNPRLVIDNEHAYSLLKNLFTDVLGSERRGIALDICTGSGIHLPLLSQCSKTIIGADLSHGLLKRAQEVTYELCLKNTFLLQSQAESIPLKDNVCDAVIMIDAIHHVENQHKVLEEIKRVAKNHAPFLLIEPNVSNPLVYLAHRIPIEERGALRANTAGGLRRLLSGYIDNIDVQPFNYVASQKTGFTSRISFQAIEYLFEKIFFFWPIRLLIKGYIVK